MDTGIAVVAVLASDHKIVFAFLDIEGDIVILAYAGATRRHAVHCEWKRITPLPIIFYRPCCWTCWRRLRRFLQNQLRIRERVPARQSEGGPHLAGDDQFELVGSRHI